MKIFKNSIIYLGSSTINKAIPFLMLPVLTKYLDPSEFGIWAIFQVFISVFVSFIGMNMQVNITRSFHKRSQFFVSTIVYNLILLLLSMSILMSLVITFTFIFFDNLFGIEYKYFILLPIIVFLQYINIFNLTVYRNQDRAVKYGIYEIGITFVNISIAILLIVSLNYSWLGMVYGVLCSQFIFAILSIRSLINSRLINKKFKKQLFKNITLLSLPLIPHTLADAIIQLSDRLFIEHMLSVADVGIYTVATYFGLIIYMITTSFNKTWTPWMMKMLAKKSHENDIKIVKYTYLYFPIVAILSVITIIASYILLEYMVDSRYHKAEELIPWITIGFLIRGSYSMIFPYMAYTGKTKILAKLAIYAAVINVFLNYFFIKYNGLVGAAQATIISYIILTIVTWIYANKIYPMPWLYFIKRRG